MTESTAEAGLAASVKIPIILASASRFRRDILRNAGVPAETEAAAVDEAAVKEAMRAENATAGEVAQALAELKAQRVSRRYPGAFVIGADQMLECDGRWFDKPGDLQEAEAHLRALSGQTHQLYSAVCVVCDGACLWQHLVSPRMTMRPLSSGFISEYLEANGESICDTVGAYQLEALGAQLFARVEGDYFAILGLPLLPLLDFLRGHGVVGE